MQLIDKTAWSSAFKGFWQDFAKYLKRQEARGEAEKYVRGLLAKV